MLTGWVFARTMRDNAEKYMITALDAAYDEVPFPLLDMDFGNGSEFINHEVAGSSPAAGATHQPRHPVSGLRHRLCSMFCVSPLWKDYTYECL